MGSQARVPWHSSHWTVVTKWLGGIPGALEPLWQEVQAPVTAL